MYFGLDVHKKFIQVCKLSDSGEVISNAQVGGDQESIRLFAESLKAKDAVVLETTFNSWGVYNILRRHSKARIVVSDANQVKAIAHAKVKTDKVDAEILARLLKADFIPEVQMPDEKTWSYRQLVSHMKYLSKQRTSIKNAIWSILNRALIAPPNPDLFTKKSIRWLSDLNLDPFLRLQMNNQLLLLESVSVAIVEGEEALKEVAISEKNVQLLLTIPGVGHKVALGLIAAIGDVNRFKSPSHLASYFGLTPRLSQSADRRHSGAITKSGTTTGRWLAVEAAHFIARSGSPITASFYKIKNKKGHNIAITALARKLIVVVWHILKKQEPYRYAQPERVAEKMKILKPDLPGRYIVSDEKITTEEIYQQAGLPKLSEPTAGEKRAAIRNKKQLAYEKRKQKNKGN
jgi:transposase